MLIPFANQQIYFWKDEKDWWQVFLYVFKTKYIPLYARAELKEEPNLLSISIEFWPSFVAQPWRS
jgi:hypothetical protein